MLPQIILSIWLLLISYVQSQGEGLDTFGIINVLYIKADSNHDGMMTQSELNNVFHGFDSNKDGKVTKSEFVSLWMQITKETKEHAGAIFYLADLNDDDIIDQADFGPMYQTFDLNGDGQVNAVEFAKKWASILTESPLAVLFERSDVDKNSRLSTTEFNNFLHSLDTDGNGLISKTEMEHGWATGKFGSMYHADTFFTNMDINHNKNIETSDLGRLFTKYDKNHDHELDILEVVKMANMLPPPPVIS